MILHIIIISPRPLSVVHAIVGCVREIRAENSVLVCLNQFRGVAYHGFQASSLEFDNCTHSVINRFYLCDI